MIQLLLKKGILMTTKKNVLTAITLLCCVSAVVFGGAPRAIPKDSYYKVHPLFHPYPDEKRPPSIDRFGPVGIGIQLQTPPFGMKVRNVEKGSPAEATGKLKKGQIIESINGVVLKDVDPRMLLGGIITKAEATDGIVKFMVKDTPEAAAQEVVVKIPVLGAYSKTWPLKCKKSDKIVRDFADALAKRDSINLGIDGALLFMLSTGEEKDLNVARGWVKKLVEKYKDVKEMDTYPWFVGYGGPALCEYYLRTGDESILPVIKKAADYLKKEIHNGGWNGRGGVNFKYGHMNAAGVHCVAFLMLAKECGVDVDEHTLQSSLKQFYRYTGRGNVPYGDALPERGFSDNGKTGGLAFAMAASASLSPKGEKSVYAKARDISATKSFYSTSWMFHGHTGGGIGELWRGAAMGLVRDKRPAEYQSFMDGRRWVYELARTHDGVFGWPSGWNVNYVTTGRQHRPWGDYIPLVYTIPRKQLRMYGAPKTKYSRSYKIPDRPWGTAADDVFYSLQSGDYKPGKRQDISAERLITDASMPILERLKNSKISDDTLLMYAYHIDQAIRSAAAKSINQFSRYHLVVPLLKSKDPRARYTGVTCITGMNRGRPLPADQLTDEMFDLVAEMIRDPQESWWVNIAAMNALKRARPELIAPHVDRLSYWLNHDEWWLRDAAMKALTPIASDKRLYKQVWSDIGKMISTNQRPGVVNSLGGIVRQLQGAEPKVQKYALKQLSQAYLNFPAKLNAPGGQDMSNGLTYLLDGIAGSIVNLPGGYDELYRISKKRMPEQNLPHQDLYLKADASKFGPKLKKDFMPIVIGKLIPEYIEKTRHYVDQEAKANKPGGAIEGLVALYRKAGIHDYDWKHIGPKRTEIKWYYNSFNPQDGKIWENGHRYRKVDWPAGMENWFSPQFDPKAAGWQTGYAPFGHYNGTMEYKGRCKDNFCGCGEPLKTFWDKEVLMMRAEIKMPPLKKGYAYRVNIGGRSHVGSGDGTDLWIDGKRIGDPRKNQPSIDKPWRNQGGKPAAAPIGDGFEAQFKDGKIILSATGFLRMFKPHNIKTNRQSFWFEEMKVPPLDDK